MPTNSGITQSRKPDREYFIFPVKRHLGGLKYFYTFYWHFEALTDSDTTAMMVRFEVKNAMQINLN